MKRMQAEVHVKEILQTGAELTDLALERLLPPGDATPSSIHRAMRHSTFAGGKRLRPILVMEAARMIHCHQNGGGELPEGVGPRGAHRIFNQPVNQRRNGDGVRFSSAGRRMDQPAFSGEKD